MSAIRNLLLKIKNFIVLISRMKKAGMVTRNINSLFLIIVPAFY